MIFITKFWVSQAENGNRKISYFYFFMKTIFHFCHRHKNETKKARKNDASPRINQNNRIVWQPRLKQSPITLSLKTLF
jgi:hypothetical protein